MALWICATAFSFIPSGIYGSQQKQPIFFFRLIGIKQCLISMLIMILSRTYVLPQCLECQWTELPNFYVKLSPDLFSQASPPTHIGNQRQLIYKGSHVKLLMICADLGDLSDKEWSLLGLHISLALHQRRDSCRFLTQWQVASNSFMSWMILLNFLATYREKLLGWAGQFNGLSSNLMRINWGVKFP